MQELSEEEAMKPELPERLWVDLDDVDNPLSYAESEFTGFKNENYRDRLVPYVPESLLEPLRIERDRYKAALERINNSNCSEDGFEMWEIARAALSPEGGR